MTGSAGLRQARATPMAASTIVAMINAYMSVAYATKRGMSEGITNDQTLIARTGAAAIVMDKNKLLLARNHRRLNK